MAENRTTACCVASRPGATATGPVPAPATRGAGPSARDGLVDIPGGAFLMGTADPEGFPADGEGPVREVTVRPFRLARHAVTNAAFAAFVQATGYATEAEHFGWSFVFHLFVPQRRRIEIVGAAGPAPWWLAVKGACWRAPEGPGSTTKGRGDHPVVHVSWHDAAAYCAWAGGACRPRRSGSARRAAGWRRPATPGGTT